MDSINRLKELFSSNESDRIAKEKQQQDRTADPNLLRHTLYQGDRTIQQLGQEPIENGVILNNQSLAIGDVMLPLAKGNVLRRVDNTNGGALLGTAYRDALENDYDANGRRRKAPLSRNGGNEPSDPNNPNKPNKRNPDRVPPPSGCTPPPPKCFWSKNPIAPKGFQNHGDAVVNQNGLPVYLHCMAGTNAPSNLNCSFLDTQRWSCSGGVCSLNPTGIYTSQAQCQAALVSPPTSEFNPSGKANGWWRLSKTTGNPSGYTLSESTSPGGLIKSTVFSYVILTPTTLLRYIDGVPQPQPQPVGYSEGVDGSNILSLNWYFIENGVITSPLRCP